MPPARHDSLKFQTQKTRSFLVYGKMQILIIKKSCYLSTFHAIFCSYGNASLRGQTVHWIGAQLVIVGLWNQETRLETCSIVHRTVDENERSKEEHIDLPFRGIRLQFTYYLVWPSNDEKCMIRFFQTKKIV